MNDYKNLNKHIIDLGIDPRTYYDYLKLKDVNTKPFLMIAELIDNAIASFENEYGDQWKKVLEINIEMNFVGEETTINDLKVFKGTYIKFTDNAFGMDKETLRNAVRLNNKSDSRSKMNVHGRGLKQCAFYFGIDLVIKTKEKNQQGWKVEQMLSQQESIDSIYYIHVKESDKQSNGTEIKISNLHLDKEISETRWNNIRETLEYRYIKYFQKDQLRINYRCFYKKSEKEDNFKLKEEPKITIVQGFSILGEKKLSKFSEFIEIINVDIQKTWTKKGDDVYKNTLFETQKIIQNIFQKAKTCSQTLFDFEIELKIKNKKIPFQFWMLPAKRAKYRGIRLFEGNRAIKHVCSQQEIETKPYMSWKKGRMETGSTENRFAGSCDLSLLGLVSKTDKSSFTIPEETQREIDKQIFSVWTAFNSFVIHSRKEEWSSEGIRPSSEEKDKLFAISKTKFCADNISYLGKNDEDDFVSYEYITHQNENFWTIDIKVNISRKPSKIVGKKIKGEENIEITVFTAHPFWHQITKLKASFYTEAVVPIALLVAIQYIEWSEKTEHPIFSENKASTIDFFNTSGKIFINEKN